MHGCYHRGIHLREGDRRSKNPNAALGDCSENFQLLTSPNKQAETMKALQTDERRTTLVVERQLTRAARA